MRIKSALLTLMIVGQIFGAAALPAQESDKKIEKSKIPEVDSSGVSSSDSARADDIPGDVVIAYYFHTTRRCASCRKIESYSDEAINTAFAEELKQGKLVWRPVNTDEAENKHFINDYQLYTKSLILAQIQSGQQIRWKNLDKIWLLLKDKKSFVEYVQNEVGDFLKGK